jgi:hypothetical protein
VPKYTVVAHKRVVKFLAELREEALKERIKETIRKLLDYRRWREKAPEFI